MHFIYNLQQHILINYKIDTLKEKITRPGDFFLQ